MFFTIISLIFVKNSYHLVENLPVPQTEMQFNLLFPYNHAFISEESADKIAGGSLITRMTNDTAQITQFTNGMLRIFFNKAPVMCLGSIILALILSPRMMRLSKIGTALCQVDR
jgi:ABC-type multidrug transport system fused ATPase/permease subunit